MKKNLFAVIMTFCAISAHAQIEVKDNGLVTLEGKQYLFVKDVICTSDRIDNTCTDEGEVIFKAGSDYTFERSGTFKIEKGVKIERGAKFCIKPSNLNY